MNIIALIELINLALIRDYGYYNQYMTVEEYKAHSGIDISRCAHANTIIQGMYDSNKYKP